MSKIYISGKITGLDLADVKVKFQTASDELRRKGWQPVNPLDIEPPVSNPKWNDYMKADIIEMLKCEAVYALRDWQDSKGATIEVELARVVGMPVYPQVNGISMLKAA